MDPNLKDVPRRVDRRAAAELVSNFFFPISHRTLEKAPLSWRHLNGRALVDTVELLEWAAAKVAASTPIRGGRRVKPAE